MFCSICYFCGNCKRKKNEEAEWRYPQGDNDAESLANWLWDPDKDSTQADNSQVNYKEK